MVGLAAALAAMPALASALCTSDGVPPPGGVLERFVSADCAECWQDRATPDAGANILALDWVVPGAKGDDAPLSAVASRDALARLQALRRAPPQAAEALTTLRKGPAPRLRLAQGASFNDYVAGSFALQAGGPERWEVWLLLVEALPAGTEGSPVARNLVRNAFWARTPRLQARWNETRSLQIREGAKADRLRLVALALDARGRMRAIAQTECRE